MNEQWKDVPGYEGRYQVSDAGRIKALSRLQMGGHGLRRVRERILAQQTINSGYRLVHLHADNQRQALLVHRLVAQAFHPGADLDLDVNHIDGDKQNNAALQLTGNRYNGTKISACLSGRRRTAFGWKWEAVCA